MHTFHSIYLGIVVQNNDPEYRGRVKVWVPHISTTIYSKWNELKKDQIFSVPGSPDGENFSAIIEDLKDTLPWAEFCSPITGQSSTGYYNSRFDVNQVSDAPVLYGQPGSNYTNTLSSTKIDPENKGGKPGALYESQPVEDAFGNTAKINSKNVNPYSANYKPATYSNAAKGIFSVPNVGAHVWVFFREGIPQYPVYIGASFGQQDFESIFKSGDNTFPDYPGAYENKDKRVQPNPDTDTTTYRNKMVVSQRGAAIEIINTTDRESYKVTHFQGGYYELNNKFTALFNPKNFQLLTLKDKFETVNGFNNLFIGRDSDNIIQGDHYLKVGNLDIETFTKWNDLVNQITSVSPSDTETLKTTITDLTDKLAAQEKEMGFGGNSFELITKDKIVTVGIVANEAPVINISELETYDIIGMVAPGYKNLVKVPVKKVNLLYVPDTPGNYTITTANRFTMQSGAGGANIQTLGQLKLSGVVTDVRGEMVNIGGSKEVNIDSSVLTITGDYVYLKNKGGGQVVVDSNLGVSKNVVIGGGAYVEGELTVNHITAPIEYQVTENTQIIAVGPPTNIGIPGKPGTGWSIIGAVPTGTLTLRLPTGVAQCEVIGGLLNFIQGGTLTIAQPHSHVFKNIPLTLLQDPPASNNLTSEFKAQAELYYDPYKKEPVSSESRLDGRIQTVGIPPPSIFITGADGNIFNFPNGPGSNVVGPRLTPLT